MDTAAGAAGAGAAQAEDRGLEKLATELVAMVVDSPHDIMPELAAIVPRLSVRPSLLPTGQTLPPKPKTKDPKNQNICSFRCVVVVVVVWGWQEVERRKEGPKEARPEKVLPQPSRDNNYSCPFVSNADGTFSARLSSDPSGAPRPLNNSAILAACVFATPLPKAKRQQYSVLKGLERFFRPVWQAANGGVDLGTLLPPYHLSIALRMALNTAGSGGDDDDEYFWLMLDKTDEGVRYKTGREEKSGTVPDQLLKGKIGGAESTLVHEFIIDYKQQKSLYDVLAVVVDDPKPASLASHLTEAASVKDAINAFATTSCWEFVARVTTLFDSHYSLAQAFDMDTGCLLVDQR